MQLPEIFRHRDFVRLLTARALSSLSMGMLSVAIGWQVYEVARQTMSVPQAAFMVGMIGLVQFVPILLLALPAGQIVDRHSRKVILATCVLLELLTALALLGITFLPQGRQLELIFLIAAFFGVIRAFYPASSSAILPMLVPRSELPTAIAWMTTAYQVGTIGGPAIVGFLIALSIGAVYAISAGFLAIGALSAWLIATDTRPKAAAQRGFAAALEGLKFVYSNKVIFGAVMLDLVIVLLAGATALLPAFARDILKTGPMGLGLLRAAPAIGGLAASIYLTRKPLTRHLGRWMLSAVIVFGVGTVAFGLSRNLALSCLCLAITGAADNISVFVRHNLVQILTPDAMRGRVGSVNMLFISASNELGEFESGVAARFLAPVGAVLFGGIGSIFIGLVWGKLFPKLRDTDTLEFAEPESPAIALDNEAKL
ncbi:MAG: MFS transporter [Caulobacterales bacterium]